MTPRLVADEPAALVEFLRRAFGGTGELRTDRPSQILIGDSIVMVSGVGPREAMPAFLYLYVDDAGETYGRAVAAGAEPIDTPYGDRRAMVRDPGGNVWQIATYRGEAGCAASAMSWYSEILEPPMANIQITAQDLRDVVAAIIAPGITIHRAARNAQGYGVGYLDGSEPCDEEIDDFIASNLLFDEELRMHLIDPGLLGFHSQICYATQEAIDEFRRNVGQWAASPEWLEARLLWLPSGAPDNSAGSLLWIPDTGPRPGWVVTARSYVLIAAQLLARGRLLSELTPRDFEFLLGELLEHDGWRVEVTRGTRDGGMDVIATRTDPGAGELRTLWQAKKYSPGNNVRLSQVRELSAVLERERASKALIITTSQLTRDALAWIRRDTYRLGAKSRKDVEDWVLEVAGLKPPFG